MTPRLNHGRFSVDLRWIANGGNAARIAMAPAEIGVTAIEIGATALKIRLA